MKSKARNGKDYSSQFTFLLIISIALPCPPITQFDSFISRVIVEFAEIILSSAIDTPFNMVFLHPIQTWLPIVIGLGEFMISSSASRM